MFRNLIKLLSVIKCATVFAMYPSLGYSDRLSVLTESSIYDRFANSDDWQIIQSGQKIEYLCTGCEGYLHASIEVIDLRPDTRFDAFKDAYLAARKAFCADIATWGKGRCVNTVETSLRPMLPAFASEHENDVTRTSEDAIYYWNTLFGNTRGPEKIIAKVTADRDADELTEIHGVMRRQILRLTKYW